MKKYLLDKSGEVTVFLTLLFLLIIGFVYCILGGMHDYSQTVLAEDAVIGAGEYVTSNYDKELNRRYHIFFMDPRERAYIEEDGKSFFRDYFDDSILFQVSCDDLAVSGVKTAVDSNGLYLRHQIREFMKYQSVKTIGSNVYSLFESVKKDQSKTGSASSKIASAANEKKTEEKAGAKEKEELDEQAKAEQEKRTSQWKKLKNTIGGIVSSGILLFAVGKNRVSNRSIGTSGLPSKAHGYKGAGEGKKITFSFSNAHEIQNLLKGENATASTNMLTDKLLEIQYIFSYFTDFCSDQKTTPDPVAVEEESVTAVATPEEGDHALKYEIEYLIAGNASDRKNLSYVVNRLTLIRFVTNFIHAITAEDLNGMAEGVSQVAVVPIVTKVVKYLILTGLSIGETYIDMRCLMRGEKVPVTKTMLNWNLTITNLDQCFASDYKVKKGSVNVSYNDFLLLLLMMNWKEARIYYRMMDIMQVNVALVEPGFKMKDSIFAYQWDWTLQHHRWFSVIPVYGLKNSKSFDKKIQKICTY